MQINEKTNLHHGSGFVLKRNGFTLIELLVVVAIIGILAALGTVAYNGYTGAARKAVVRSNLNSVTKFVSTELIKCIAGDQISTWSGSTGINGSPPNIVVQRDCDTSGNAFLQNAGYAFMVFSEDITKFANPFNASDNNGGFRWNWDPPEPEDIGRVTCGQKPGDTFISCYGRWGSGTNDFETTIINNPL